MQRPVLSFAEPFSHRLRGTGLGSRQEIPAVPHTLDARVLRGEAIALCYVNQHSCTHAAQPQSQAFKAQLRSIAVTAEHVIGEMEYGTVITDKTDEFRFDIEHPPVPLDPTSCRPLPWIGVILTFKAQRRDRLSSLASLGSQEREPQGLKVES